MEKKFSNRDKSDAYYMLLEGASIRQISERFGVSYQRIQQILPQGRTDKRAADTCVFSGLSDYLKKTGASYSKLAKQSGISVPAIMSALKGERSPNKKTIDAILRSTGLTYEEAFRPKEKNHEQEQGMR